MTNILKVGIKEPGNADCPVGINGKDAKQTLGEPGKSVNSGDVRTGHWHIIQKLKGKLDFITLEPNVFAVFFPDDGRMPTIRHGKKKQKVRKIVVKIPVKPA